jgi:hypothetical protein
MEKILLVGGNFALLAPRAAVLAKMVSNVTCCNPSEFGQMPVHEEFALVVLCHSLDEEDLLHIAFEVRQRWPRSRLLHIWERKGQPSPVEQRVDAIVAPEPRKLAGTVATLLTKPGVTRSNRSAAAPASRKIA